jgi:hypothetical protein
MRQLLLRKAISKLLREAEGDNWSPEKPFGNVVFWSDDSRPGQGEPWTDDEEEFLEKIRRYVAVYDKASWWDYDYAAKMYQIMNIPEYRDFFMPPDLLAGTENLYRGCVLPRSMVHDTHGYHGVYLPFVDDKATNLDEYMAKFPQFGDKGIPVEDWYHDEDWQYDWYGSQQFISSWTTDMRQAIRFAEAAYDQKNYPWMNKDEKVAVVITCNAAENESAFMCLRNIYDYHGDMGEAAKEDEWLQVLHGVDIQGFIPVKTENWL